MKATSRCEYRPSDKNSDIARLRRHCESRCISGAKQSHRTGDCHAARRTPRKERGACLRLAMTWIFYCCPNCSENNLFSCLVMNAVHEDFCLNLIDAYLTNMVLFVNIDRDCKRINILENNSHEKDKAGYRIDRHIGHHSCLPGSRISATARLDSHQSIGICLQSTRNRSSGRATGIHRAGKYRQPRP